MPRHYLRGNRISCFCFLCQSNHWRSLKSIPAAFQNGPGGAGGGKRGGGHQLRSAIVCLRKRRRGSPPPPRPLPALTSSLLLVHQPHNGVTSKISCAGLSQAGPPTPTVFSAGPGCVEGQPGGGRDPIFNRRFVSSQQFLLFPPSLSSTQPLHKSQPPPSFDKMPGGAGWRGGEGVAEKMRAVCHVPVSKEQIHLYHSY